MSTSSLPPASSSSSADLPQAPTSPSARAMRIAGWIDRYRRLILFASVLLVALAGALASRLPVHTDFSYLLPPSADSVKQLRSLEKRAMVFGTVMIGVESDDPILRERAARDLGARLKLIDRRLVAGVTFDDGAARQFVWDHRFLYVSVDDLTQARDALSDKIHKAKLKANPLYVDFEDDDDGKDAQPQPKDAQPKDAATDKAAGADTGDKDKADKTEALRARLKEAEKKKDEPAEFLSKDGRLQLIVVRSAFSSGEVASGRVLLDAVRTAIDATRAEVGPQVEIGYTGDVPMAIAEHASILNGMLLATFLTVGLVTLAMVAFYRSVRAVGALLWALAVGAIATFGFTKLAIGHLNLATAFLSSIVVGNGINCGIVLLARHMEERRHGLRGVEAIAAAMAGTWTGTLTAALTASVAYASLIVTDFRGFRHFGIIGGVGMVLCWIAAYTVLPAALATLERRRLLVPGKAPGLGPLLARILPKRLGALAIVSLLVTSGAGVLAYGYLRHVPYEDNFHNLRSSSAKLHEIHRWTEKFNAAFGPGISGGFAIAVPERTQTAPLVARLRAMDDGKDADHRLFRRINSLDDALPTDQPQKLALLEELRKLLDDDALADLDDADRSDALRLRPPPGLRALDDHDVPPELAWPFTELDGTRGRLILADEGAGYDTWVAKDLFRWTDQFRKIPLGDGTLVGGSAFVLSDVLRSTASDGPKATLAAMIGAVLVVFLLVGVRKHGMITLMCGASGTMILLAIASLVGLKVNFLDFVALPITIGIGIDYSVNVVVRERQDGGPGSARRALATTGGAVALCSFTTIVGYGSLLLSENRGIRSFGLAAILGEATCLTAALALAPALLHVLRRRRSGDPGDRGGSIPRAVANDDTARRKLAAEQSR